MKSFLSLIPISTNVHKRQNRMTILCIIISVLLVTAIFSVADMFIRTESDALQDKHGSWHICLSSISQDTAEEIGRRTDVTAVGWSEVFNADADQPYYIGEKKAALYGADAVYMTLLTNAIEEGFYPQNSNEILLSSNSKLALDVQIGDTVSLQSPAGNREFVISGFGSDESSYYQGQTYLVAAYLTPAAFDELMEMNGISCAPSCYVQFENAEKAADAVSEFQEQYAFSEDSISENTALMGIAGQSSNESMQNVYGMAAILFILVLLAGVLMISGSMNSNVSQRIKFFGMMRCIGASRQQIIRFVRLEALNWCKTAVPAGLLLGTAVSWIICALLHYGIGGEFSTMPVFALSPVGLICGAVVGVITVLLAAQAPAKYASKISPMAAVSGNGTSAPPVKHQSVPHFNKVEWTLGMHHATVSKKNWILMSASFALSIILFLCFSVGLDFAYELLPSLRPWQPDITLGGYANELVLSQDLTSDIRSMAGVEHVWGSSYIENVPAGSSQSGIDHVNLISYDDALLDIAEEQIVTGNMSDIYGESSEVMTVIDKDNPLKVGDTLQIGNNTVTITCALSEGIYSGDYSVICSQDTFQKLTGEQNFNLIGIQLNVDADDETIKEISSLADGSTIFTDLRERNKEDRTTYIAAQFLIYSFLGIIAMISLFNIINTISMSVTARTKQYGAMRAVGMDSRQITRMISAEAFTYAFSGLIIGCGTGLPLSRFLHLKLITRYFGVTWSFPYLLISIVIVFVLVSVVLAIHKPSKHLCDMTITTTINEL